MRSGAPQYGARMSSATADRVFGSAVRAGDHPSVGAEPPPEADPPQRHETEPEPDPQSDEGLAEPARQDLAAGAGPQRDRDPDDPGQDHGHGQPDRVTRPHEDAVDDE